MPSSTDVLKQARKWLGTQENPRNSNRTPIGVKFGWNGVAWCAETVCVCLQDAGFKFQKSASCSALINELKRVGFKTVPKSAGKPGDVVFFNWPGTAYTTDHVGFIEGKKSDGRYITIEGNVQLPNGNGGVSRKIRSTGTMHAIVRPTYTSSTRPKPAPQPSHQMPPTLKPGARGPWVRTIQLHLGKLAVTGRYGEKTEQAIKRFQKNHKLKADGIVGANTWKALGW